MTTALRILRHELRHVGRHRWVLAYGAGLILATELLLRLGGTGPRAIVSLLNLLILVVPLVTIVFGTIYWHGAREFTELLLAQPVTRSALFHGLFAGLVVPLAVAFVAGVTLPLAWHGMIDSETLRLLLLLDGAGVALTAVFAALAVLIASRVDDRLRAVALALGTWAAMTLAWDAVILWVTVAFAAWPLERPLLALTFANPVDLARVLTVLQLDVAALMGYTGAVFNRLLGSSLGVLTAVAGLAAWALVPGLVALRGFNRRDF
jgi:Cu-processing system permease protein